MSSKIRKPRLNHKSSRIPPEAMEIIADVLIATCGKDSDYPAYNQQQFDRKTRRASSMEFHLGLFDADAQQNFADQTPHLAQLTERERFAWQKYSEGFNPNEISRLMNVSRPTVVRLLKIAAHKISMSKDPNRGLGEVYRQDTRRCIYRKPAHCAAEHCKKLGYCKYASYGRAI